MDDPNQRCHELVSITEMALDDDNIARLFLVTERVNLDDTAIVAVRRCIRMIITQRSLIWALWKGLGYAQHKIFGGQSY
jgi:hypothetical protein